jgi:tetratricopeptide (TPR) repeat protein
VAGGGLDAARAVQVVARHPGDPWFGSGYQVSDDLVITARHVVVGATSVAVRFVDASGQVREMNAQTVWDHAMVDVAVLRLATAMRDIAPIRYGRLVGLAACEAVGYPWFKLRGEHVEADGADPEPFRDTHHARGTCSLHSDRRSGTLELSVTAAPAAHPDPAKSSWQGMSGAAVFAGDALIAVVTENYEREGPGFLTARPVTQWHTLPPERLTELRALLGVPGQDQLVAVSGTPTAAPTALRQLPQRLAGFTGRTKQVTELVAHLAGGSGKSAVVVTAVAGLAGIGKTALAIEAAHTAVDSGVFPGGVLFLDLHGYDEVPVSADQALDSLLRALGTDPRYIPPDLQGRIGMYRSYMAGIAEPVLVIADNAAFTAQVEPLLPGPEQHRLLITSRHTLSLTARRLDLTVLSDAEAVDLMDTALRLASPDDDRISSDPDAALRVAGYCAGLPLALCIAAALLIIDDQLTAAKLTDALADEGNRLDILDDGERALKATFGLSFRRLAPEHQRLFRLLALNPGPDLSTAAAAALAGRGEAATGNALTQLLRAHMIEHPPGQPARWRMHDLIRAFADDLTTQRPDSERQMPVHRLLDFYLHATRAANRYLVPGRLDITLPAGEAEPEPLVFDAVPRFTAQDEALAWLEAERPNLEACVVLAGDTGEASHATSIAFASATFFRQAGHWRQSVALHETAGRVAAAAHDQRGHADALTNLGEVQRMTGEYAAATTNLDAGLTLYRELGDRRGQAAALTFLGALQWMTDRNEEATTSLTEALTLHRELGDRLGQANALNNLGEVQRLMGKYPAATASWTEALTLSRKLGNRLGQTNALTYLGVVQWMTGEYAAAAANLNEALTLSQGAGDRLGQANALTYLGVVQWMTREYAAAIANLNEALTLYRELGIHIGQAGALTYIGALQHVTGKHTAAAAKLTEALALFRELGDQSGEAEAMNRYATLVAAADTARGRSLHRDALHIAREISSRWDEANALSGIGVTYRLEGNRAMAQEHFQQALELYLAMGCAADVARVKAEIDGLENLIL